MSRSEPKRVARYGAVSAARA